MCPLKHIACEVRPSKSLTSLAGRNTERESSLNDCWCVYMWFAHVHYIISMTTTCFYETTYCSNSFRHFSSNVLREAHMEQLSCFKIQLVEPLYTLLGSGTYIVYTWYLSTQQGVYGYSGVVLEIKSYACKHKLSPKMEETCYIVCSESRKQVNHQAPPGKFSVASTLKPYTDRAPLSSHPPSPLASALGQGTGIYLSHMPTWPVRWPQMTPHQ